MGPIPWRVKSQTFFGAYSLVEITFVLKVMLYLGYFRLFRVDGWSGGRVGGRVAGKAEIITNSAQLGLELGLSLAKFGLNNTAKLETWSYVGSQTRI